MSDPIKALASHPICPACGKLESLSTCTACGSSMEDASTLSELDALYAPLEVDPARLANLKAERAAREREEAAEKAARRADVHRAFLMALEGYED